jgi:hypothetical protein
MGPTGFVALCALVLLMTCYFARRGLHAFRRNTAARADRSKRGRRRLDTDVGTRDERPARDKRDAETQTRGLGREANVRWLDPVVGMGSSLAQDRRIPQERHLVATSPSMRQSCQDTTTTRQRNGAGLEDKSRRRDATHEVKSERKEKADAVKRQASGQSSAQQHKGQQMLDDTRLAVLNSELNSTGQRSYPGAQSRRGGEAQAAASRPSNSEADPRRYTGLASPDLTPSQARILRQQCRRIGLGPASW